MKFTKSWAAAAATVALTGAAQAALVLQANGLEVLDTNTNLIWLHDWNLNGKKNWATQNAWAETTLDGFAGSNDWRLPEISEYFALFNSYGNLSQVTAFTNVQTSASYWSGTVFTIGTAFTSTPSQNWIFSTSNGNRGATGLTGEFYGVAVRRGDVIASVPEPQTLALALLALGVTVAVRRRRPR